MDVQADTASFRADPDATAVVQQPQTSGPHPEVTGRHPQVTRQAPDVTGQHPQVARQAADVTRQHPQVSAPQPVAPGQGQLFADPYATYAHTNQIPAVSSAPRAPRPAPARWLRVTVGMVALVVLAAGAALGLVQAGVIGKTTPTSSTATAPTSHPATSVPNAPLVTKVSSGAGTATYQVGIAAYAVTVATSTGRAWVSIGTAGKAPTYAGIVPPNSSHKEILLGASQVDVGAGGTTVVITSGHRSATLTPPSAPFSYHFQPKG